MKWLVKPQIGIDIGHRTIKAIKLTKKSGRVYLDSYFFHDLVNGNPKFPVVSALGETLDGLVEVAGFSDFSVAAAIDDSEVTTFDMSFPEMPAAEIAEAVMGELENRIHYPIEEASIDHKIVARTEENSNAMLMVKAYCARKSEIKSILELLESAKLRPESIDLAMLSNIEMLAFNGYLEDDSYAIIVDLGESRASAALVKGRRHLLTNSIPVSFGAMNRRLYEASSILYLEAEQMKLNMMQGQTSEQLNSQEVLEAVYLDLFRQLQKSVDFFKASSEGKSISKILVIGGGSRFPSVCTTMTATFGIEVVVANPFRSIDIFVKGKQPTNEIAQISSHMATAVGLALRGLNVAG